MLAIIKSMSLRGLDGYLVEVQVDVSGGMPSCDIVGLPDTSVKEAKERVRAAIKNTGIDLKSRKILINLAPADTKKEGAIYDLPIAIAMLVANEEIRAINLENTIFIGELSLDGKVKGVNGIFPMCLEARKIGIKTAIIPYENANEAAIVNGINIIGVKNLNEVIEIMNGEAEPKTVQVDLESLFTNDNKYKFDFVDVKGQENIKRALEVAAAGGHNCLLIRKSRIRKNNDVQMFTFNTTRFKF